MSNVKKRTSVLNQSNKGYDIFAKKCFFIVWYDYRDIILGQYGTFNRFSKEAELMHKLVKIFRFTVCYN